MKVMITGAQFNNKGAQSLLFSVMDYLKKKSREVEIYYLPLDDYRKYNNKLYRFEIVYGGMEAHYYENYALARPFILAKAWLRKIVKKSAVSISDVTKLHRVLPEMDAIIDVSGYQLTSKFPYIMNRKFLYYIEEAKRHSKKVVLMPQSFGPFEYTEKKEKMHSLIKKDLNNADLIFAREKDGFDLLRNQFGVKNLLLSPDLVLQCGEIDWNNIYTSVTEIEYPILKTKGNVAIIPNTEPFKHGDERLILSIYKEIIDELLCLGKMVYIFRHSRDLEACKKIYDLFRDNEKVVLIEDEFECSEYSRFIEQFDYIVASRYHAIVHAYREDVPAIVLGWAVKYQELAELFGQQAFVFDITRGDLTNLKVSELIQTMNNNFAVEKERIKKTLKKLSDSNCMDICWNVICEGDK